MSWPLVKLLDCCDISTGKFDANHGVTEGLFPFYTCAERPIAANTYSFDGDSIILPGNGANVGLVLFYSGKFEAYQRTYVLNSFKQDVYSRYVFHHLSRYWKLRNERAQFGSATNYIRMQNFEDYQVPLPPLEEQKRIAAILDKADTIRRKRQQAIKLADDFLRSVFLEMFGDPVTNPKGWDLLTLDEVCSKITDGEHGTVARVESGRPYLMARNIDKHGNLDLTEISYISDADHKKIYKRCGAERGDILLVCVGATIGKALIVPEMEEFSLARSVALLKPKDKTSSQYLLYLIKSAGIQQKFVSSGNSSAQAGLYLGKIKALKIPFPPLELQADFSVVETRIKSILSKYECGQSAPLFESLSQKAFSGMV